MPATRPISFGSLFAGIPAGGFDLGLERAGMECAWQVENDPYCNRVLAKHWPEVLKYGDIKEVDWSEVERVDLVCGGFPCQDLSIAGKKEGLHGPRSGLYTELLFAVEWLRPEWVVVENVYHSWRRWMPQLRRALYRVGLASLPFRLRAADFGAPHIRSRGFILAHRDSERLRELKGRWRWPSREEEGVAVFDGSLWVPGDGARLRRREGRSGGASSSLKERYASVRLGRRHWWASEPELERLVHGIPPDVERNRALGNAVVPQVAEWIGRRILDVAK